MCLVWKIIGFDKHSNPGPKHLGSFERQNCAIFLALTGSNIRKLTPNLIDLSLLSQKLAQTMLIVLGYQEVVRLGWHIINNSAARTGKILCTYHI